MGTDLRPPTHDRLAAAYAILRTHPDLNLEGFAALLEMGVPEAAALLDQLVDLSLVRRDHGSDRFYVPAAPAEPSTSERVEGVAAVRRRLQELADGARQEVLAFAPPARDASAARHASRRPDREVLARGVVTRTLYLDTIVNEPQALAYAAELVAAGAQVRLVPDLPIRLIIVDHRVAAIPIDPRDGSVGALIVHDAGTVSAMVALFEAYWRNGRPIPGRTADDEFSATDIAILRLLASGAKDETVARQLGVSVRTVRRAVANLMGRLHAGSRFELAIRASNRGLLD
ncbi:MAG TPA: LuxR C-terminal-related transcriptional regulator [Micromonosporaceae bacterium]